MSTLNTTKLRPYIASNPPQLGADKLYLTGELKSIQDAIGSLTQAIQSAQAAIQSVQAALPSLATIPGAWTQITPTPVFSSGAGTAKMRFFQLGKLVFITAEVICTATGVLASVPLPVPARTAIIQQYLYGREIAVNGLGWSGIVSGPNLILATTAGNSTSMTAGFNVVLSGVYESV